MGPTVGSAPEPVVDALLAAAGRGDHGALAEFYDVTASTVFGFFVGLLGHGETAERATEDVYLRMWRLAPTFDADGGSAFSLLMRTARRELVGRLPNISV